jgi:hypothetical protein
MEGRQYGIRHPQPVCSCLCERLYALALQIWQGPARCVSGGNYLADASDMLTAGDLMMITAADGARILCVTLADVETVVTAPLS